VAPPPAPPGPPGTEGRDAPEVVRSLVDNTQLLVKKEIELAKLEIKEIVTARLMAVAFLAIAGILGLYLGVFVFVTIAKALELVVASWLAWLIVTGIVLVLVVVLLLLAKRKLSTPSNSPETTKADVQETIELAKRAKDRVQT
jgi:formate hydrogenlyase subunit 3/multisubunit Na+/H+ antiporter MnhD subunit